MTKISQKTPHRDKRVQLYNFTYNFTTSRKKGPRPKWTLYKHEPDKNKKCLNVGYSGILEFGLSSICVLAPTYISSCRGLEYLLKVQYIILVDTL